jgi:3-oxoacyl-[acyl-carrier protein] reductase
MPVHAFGPYYLSTLALPHMRERPRGDMVMIAIVAAADLPMWSSHYNMAKTAMEAMAHNLANAFQRYGVRVNIVAPGLVTRYGRRTRTGHSWQGVGNGTRCPFPFRRARPEDFAAVVAFLVSEDASYVSGQQIGVDGGGLNTVVV